MTQTDIARDSLRKRVWRAIEPSVHHKSGLSLANRFIVVAILIGVAVSILATEPTLGEPILTILHYVEGVLAVIFIVEYLARFWIAAEDLGKASALKKRWNFATSHAGVIDLFTIIVTVAPFFGFNIMALRFLRVLRILSLAKFGRLSSALRHLKEAFSSRRYELLASLLIALGLMIFGATALYWAEGALQPDKFGSIPRALWWAIVTLTTIGYGDVFPITPIGKIISGFVALAGIGVIALPAGILAAAFSDAIQRGKNEE